jgi:hypothetical protein
MTDAPGDGPIRAEDARVVKTVRVFYYLGRKDRHSVVGLQGFITSFVPQAPANVAGFNQRTPRVTAMPMLGLNPSTACRTFDAMRRIYN